MHGHAASTGSPLYRTPKLTPPPAREADRFERSWDPYHANAQHVSTHIFGAAPTGKNPVIDPFSSVSDFVRTTGTRMQMSLHQWANNIASNPSDTERALEGQAIKATKVEHGKVVLPADPMLREKAAALLGGLHAGNALAKTAFDVASPTVGMVDLLGQGINDPSGAAKRLGAGMYDYYAHPVRDFQQDPVMAALSYAPLLHAPGSILGRLHDVAMTSKLIHGEPLTTAELYRYGPKGYADHVLSQGTRPHLSPLERAALVTRALVKSPHPVERSIKVGENPDTREPLYVHPPASKSYAVGLLQKHVIDRLISHHVESGGRLLYIEDGIAREIPSGRLSPQHIAARAALGKAGREVRAEVRVQHDLRTAPLRRVEKFGETVPAAAVRKATGRDLGALRRGQRGKRLTAAQEHAAFLLSQGVTPEEFVKAHQSFIDNVDQHLREEGFHPGDAEARKQFVERHQRLIDMTRIASKYLEPGHIHPLVLEAHEAMRASEAARNRMLGISEEDAAHAQGSHWFKYHQAANGLPDLHRELEAIVNEHGQRPENARQAVEAAIADLSRRAAMSGPEKLAAHQAEIARLSQLPDDIAFKRDQLAKLDERIAALGPEQHQEGRFVDHPENLAATHRQLLTERSRLEDDLVRLEAHQRARDIHQMFVEKGHELRGTAPLRVAREQLPEIRAQLEPAQLHPLERLYGVEDGRWTPEQEGRLAADLAKAHGGEPVAPAVQSVYNTSLVAPPAAYHLPFEQEGKPWGRVGRGLPRENVHGFGPAQQPTTHEFSGRVIESGRYRTKATALATSSFSKAAHFEAMRLVHSMLWAMSKATKDEAGGERAIPIRDMRKIPDSLKDEKYRVYMGDILHGEAVDELAKQLFEEWTRPPEGEEGVRYLHPDLVRPLTPATAGAAARFINNINQAFRFGRFLSPGYVKWLPQNLVIHLVQSGPFVIRNVSKLLTEVGGLDPETYAQIANAVSFGSARALEESAASRGRVASRTIAHGWAAINDHVPRLLSFIHEAQREGFRTAEDWTNLMARPDLETQRNVIIRRANKEGIDYGAMTARERATLQAAFGYWPWVRAASLYALRFPFEHPYQAAFYMQLARMGEQTINQMFAKHGGVTPPLEEGSYPAKSGPVDLTFLDPLSQASDDANALAGLAPGHPESLGAPLTMASPLARTAMDLVTGRDQFGQPLPGGPLHGAEQDLFKRFSPYALAQEYLDSQTGAMPKGPEAAFLKWAGDPQLEGYNYDKGAQNALKDVSNVAREEFYLREDLAQHPEMRTQIEQQGPLLIRLAQIKDQGLSTAAKDRALAIADLVSQGATLQYVNSVLKQNGMKLASQGDLIAERARQRAIKVP